MTVHGFGVARFSSYPTNPEHVHASKQRGLLAGERWASYTPNCCRTVLLFFRTGILVLLLSLAAWCLTCMGCCTRYDTLRLLTVLAATLPGAPGRKFKTVQEKGRESSRSKSNRYEP